MKKVIRALPKHINQKLKLHYPDTPMGDWMLRFERISHHELAVNRNARPKITESYSITTYVSKGMRV